MNKWLEYADRLVDALDIKDVAAAHGIEFNNRGFALCPFHVEKTPSLHINNRSYLHCFSCGRNWNVVSLTQELYRLRYSEAIRKLNDQFNVGLDIDRRLTAAEREEIRRKQEKREQERAAERERVEAAERDYWKLFDKWLRLDNDLREYAPKHPNEQIDERYIYAINHIENVKLALDSAPRG